MKRFLPTLLFLVSGMFTASCQNSSPTETPSGNLPDTLASEIENLAPENIHIRISAVGDLMVHSTQFNYAKIDKDSFNFNPCFDEIRQVLTTADFTIGNLETVFAGPKVEYQGYPSFNTPDDFLDAVKTAGFDFLVSSNNHSLDRGEKGAQRTLKMLDQYGFDHTGTYNSQADRDSVRIVDIKGIKMAILNYTYGMNGRKCPAGKGWMVNEIDSSLIKKDMEAAKALDPDLVMVFFHFGLENKHEPNAYQKGIVSHTINCGADIILGAHPHVIQPVEYFKTKGGKLDTGFVAWSLGNFISNQYWRYTDAGMVLNLGLTKDLEKDSVYLSEVSYVPTWVFRGKHPDKKIHMILPAEKGLQDSSYFYLNSEWQGKMKEAFEDTKKYLNLYENIDLMKMEDWPTEVK